MHPHLLHLHKKQPVLHPLSAFCPHPGQLQPRWNEPLRQWSRWLRSVWLTSLDTSSKSTGHSMRVLRLTQVNGRCQSASCWNVRWGSLGLKDLMWWTMPLWYCHPVMTVTRQSFLLCVSVGDVAAAASLHPNPPSSAYCAEGGERPLLLYLPLGLIQASCRPHRMTEPNLWILQLWFSCDREPWNFKTEVTW